MLNLLLLLLLVLLVAALIRPFVVSRAHALAIIVWLALLLVPSVRQLGASVYLFGVILSVIAALIDRLS